jgi:hypothetical protein
VKIIVLQQRIIVSCVQLDIDFRVFHPKSLNELLSEFPKSVAGILKAARLSKKTAVVQLLRDYDSRTHTDLGERDSTYAFVALLHLLPSSNTRQKGKLSSLESESQFVSFEPE